MLSWELRPVFYCDTIECPGLAVRPSTQGIFWTLCLKLMMAISISWPVIPKEIDLHCQSDWQVSYSKPSVNTNLLAAILIFVVDETIATLNSPEHILWKSLNPSNLMFWLLQFVPNPWESSDGKSNLCSKSKMPTTFLDLHRHLLESRMS